MNGSLSRTWPALGRSAPKALRMMKRAGMIDDIYGEAYAAGKDKANFDLRHWDRSHANDCGCEPCVTVRAVLWTARGAWASATARRSTVRRTIAIRGAVWRSVSSATNRTVRSLQTTWTSHPTSRTVLRCWGAITDGSLARYLSRRWRPTDVFHHC